MKAVKTTTPETEYQFKNEQPVFQPFGPLVYLDHVAEEAVDELDKLIEELGGNIEFDASGRLAGRIKKQTDLTDSISDSLSAELMMHCDRFSYYATGVSGQELRLDGVWSNIKEAREFNPPHSHSGNYSFVVYCRNDLEKYSIEELQDNEYDNAHDGEQHPELANRKLAGLIELQYGESNWLNYNTFTHVPSRRDIIIFPSWLRHCVYAHYEEKAVRISVAGNVSIVIPDGEQHYFNYENTA